MHLVGVTKTWTTSTYQNSSGLWRFPQLSLQPPASTAASPRKILHASHADHRRATCAVLVTGSLQGWRSSPTVGSVLGCCHRRACTVSECVKATAVCPFCQMEVEQLGSLEDGLTLQRDMGWSTSMSVATCFSAGFARRTRPNMAQQVVLPIHMRTHSCLKQALG